MSTFAVFGMARDVALTESKNCTKGTSQNSKNLVQYLPTAKIIAAGFGRQFKVPTVTGALLHFTGEELAGGDRARPDTEACARVYWTMSPPAQAV